MGSIQCISSCRLDEIIAWARSSGSRLGFFPSLYRKMTIGVRDGVADGAFDDGPRMERLTVNFANRYFAALDTKRSGG